MGDQARRDKEQEVAVGGRELKKRFVADYQGRIWLISRIIRPIASAINCPAKHRENNLMGWSAIDCEKPSRNDWQKPEYPHIYRTLIRSGNLATSTKGTRIRRKQYKYKLATAPPPNINTRWQLSNSINTWCNVHRGIHWRRCKSILLPHTLAHFRIKMINEIYVKWLIFIRRIPTHSQTGQ